LNFAWVAQVGGWILRLEELHLYSDGASLLVGRDFSPPMPGFSCHCLCP
jgi:hypothetical protein